VDCVLSSSAHQSSSSSVEIPPHKIVRSKFFSTRNFLSLEESSTTTMMVTRRGGFDESNTLLVVNVYGFELVSTPVPFRDTPMGNQESPGIRNAKSCNRPLHPNRHLDSGQESRQTQTMYRGGRNDRRDAMMSGYKIFLSISHKNQEHFERNHPAPRSKSNHQT
jgi:hypothetical protein